MAFSSILPKIGKCIDCVLEGDNTEKEIVAGRCKFDKYHYSQFKAKQQNQRNNLKLSVRKAGRNQDKELESKVVKGSAELQRWFLDRRSEMVGKCANCGGQTNKDDDKYYRYCIAHLLPKAYVKSVATHPDNWLELCYFGKGCHSMLDNSMIDLIDLNCFDSVIEKFVKIYPHIATEEKRRIPKVLIEYVEVEK